MIRAVFIDYTGTTIQEGGPEMEEAVRRICQNSTLKDPKELLRVWWATIKIQEESSYKESYKTEEEILDIVLQGFVEEYGLTEDLNSIKDLVHGFWSNAPIFDDTKFFYDNCPLPIYVITNNGAFYVEKALKSKDLHTAGIICADAVRAYKPHKELFEYGLQVSGCKPEEVVHIGDSYQSDVLGAKSAGIKPILVQRGSNKKEYDDVMVVSSLMECLEILKNDKDK